MLDHILYFVVGVLIGKSIIDSIRIHNLRKAILLQLEINEFFRKSDQQILDAITKFIETFNKALGIEIKEADILNFKKKEDEQK